MKINFDKYKKITPEEHHNIEMEPSEKRVNNIKIIMFKKGKLKISYFKEK